MLGEDELMQVKPACMLTPGQGFLAGQPVRGSALDLGPGDISTAEETSSTRDGRIS